MDVPMLEETDWQQIGPLMSQASNPAVAERALDLYYRLTGFRETNINAIWHHKTNEHGPPCRECGKPLRTDRASFCAACGASRYPSRASSDQPSKLASAEEPGRFMKASQSIRSSKLPFGIALILTLAIYAFAQAI